MRGRQRLGGMSLLRVLIVDDYEPIRRFICSKLKKLADMEIICEVSDGLEAVHAAEELQPDLILLDIGLPTLNGIEAARRISKLCPNSKLLFLSEESSVHVVREALRIGALGYIVKKSAGREVVAAIDAVRQGKQFVSNGLLRHDLDVVDTPTL